jgi:hypothetical protein
MAFRSIGDLAISVLADAGIEIEASEPGRADAAQLPARPADVARGVASPKRMKDAGAEAPASSDKGGNPSPGSVTGPVLRVVSSRCKPARPHAYAPRGVGFHLVLVSDHAAPLSMID